MSTLLLIGALVACAHRASAQSVGRDAMPGAQRVGTAEHAPLLALSMTGAYGFTEDVLDDGATHDRVGGSLAAALSPARWFVASLRLDARYDAHGGGESDDGGSIDARLAARLRAAVSETVSVGGQLGAWIVGQAGDGTGPAVGAIDVFGVASLRPAGGPLLLSAQAGARFDRSGDTVTSRNQLSGGDRLALGVSDAHAVTLGFAALLGRGPWSAFLEWTWDVLVGSEAPRVFASPMHAVVGVSWIPSLAGPLMLTGFVDVTPSSRPSTGPDAPLVPIDPRIALGLQVVVRFGAASPGRELGARRRDPPPRAPRVATPRSVVRGRVLDEQGGPVADARITLTASGGREAFSTSGEDGGFEISIDATGDATLVVESAGRPRVQRTLRLAPGASADVSLALESALPLGQIRGLVRSLRGVGLEAAQIVVEPGSLQARTDGEGNFEVNVEPGEYEVIVSVDGYTPQRRRVRVEERGVVLLNLDMRRDRERRRR